jgi:hypothetical protein
MNAFVLKIPRAMPNHSPPFKRTSLLLLHGGALLLLTCLALCTGVQAATAEAPSPKTREESHSKTANAPSIETKITAEQALHRLLALIGSSQSITEWTPERLGQAMGVPISGTNKEYGFWTSLTPQWNMGFGMGQFWEDKKEWPRFDFTFTPNPPGTFPPMTDICQFDYDHFSAELKAMGFEQEPYYDMAPQPRMDGSRPFHGPLMYMRFYRPNGEAGMGIKVFPRGVDLQARDRRNERACVDMILIS